MVRFIADSKVRAAGQEGFISLGTLYLVGTAGLLLLLALRLVPVYIDHKKLLSTIESLESDASLGQKSRGNIVAMLEKRWAVNDLDMVTADNVTVTPDDGVITIQVEYDVIKPIVGNISAQVHFNDVVEVRTR